MWCWFLNFQACCTVFHSECALRLTDCPKCERIAARSLDRLVAESRLARELPEPWPSPLQGGGGCDLVIFCGKRIVIARNDARLWSGTSDFFIFSCIPFYADWLLQFVSDSAVFQSSGDIWQYFLSSVSSAYVWISSSELSNILWRLPVPVLYLGEIYLSTSRHTPASSSAYPLLFVFKC